MFMMKEKSILYVPGRRMSKLPVGHGHVSVHAYSRKKRAD